VIEIPSKYDSGNNNIGMATPSTDTSPVIVASSQSQALAVATAAKMKHRDLSHVFAGHGCLFSSSQYKQRCDKYVDYSQALAIAATAAQ
jgi:hypothetical protein